MAETIIPLKDFDINKVELSKVMPNKRGDKSCYLNYNIDGRKGSFMLRSPKFNLPFGCNDKPYKDNPVIKYSFSAPLSKDGDITPEGLVMFTNILKQLDDFILNEAVKNAKTWFPNTKNPKREIIEEFFRPCIKQPKDTTKGYSPTFSVKLPIYDQRKDPNNPKSDTYKKAGFQLFDNNKNEVHFIKDDVVDLSLLGKGSSVMCLLQCTGLHFSRGQFGLSWKAVQVKANKPKGIVGCAIVDDSDDEETEAGEEEEEEVEEEDEC